MPSRISLPLSATLDVQWRAAAQTNGVIGEVHLFLAVLESEADSAISALLTVSGVSRDEARLYAQSTIEDGPPSPELKLQWSRSASKILALAAREARLDGSTTIEPHHLFIACVSHQRGPHLGEVLRPLGLDAARLRQHLQGLRKAERPYPPGNPLNDLTQRGKKAIEAAHAEMRASYCGRISTAHLLLGILQDEENLAVTLLQKAGCDIEELKQRALQSVQSDGEIARPQKRFSPGAKRALERAARKAKRAGHKFIDCGHLLLALLPQRETLGEKWKARGQKLDSVEGLWTAEQAESLREALGNAVGGVARKSRNQSGAEQELRKISPYISFAVSFACSTLWAIYLFLLSPNSRSTAGFFIIISGVFVLVVSGLGSCVVLIFGRSPHSKAAWASVFGGWFTGMMAALVLSDIL